MLMKTNISTTLLRTIPLFAMLSEDQLAVLTTVVSRKSFARGATIIAKGDVADSLYVIIWGRLKIVIGDNRKREVILTTLGHGSYFGEMALIDDNTRSVSVIATERGEFLVLSKHEFRKCLADNFAMTMTMLRCTVRRLREADRKIGSLALMDVRSRVAEELLLMSETIDGQHVITKRVVQRNLAKSIGASWHLVCRVMKDLRLSGFIEMQGTSIYLRNSIESIHGSDREHPPASLVLTD